MKLTEQSEQNITAAQIKGWKNKYPQGIYNLSAGGLSGYVRMPTNKEVITFCSKNTNIQPRDSAKKFLRLIWLGGDIEIINNDLLFDQTEGALVSIIKDKEAQMMRQNGL